MEKLSNAANKYYSELEVLGIRDKISTFWYWSFVLNALAFVICVFLATKEIFVNSKNSNWTFVIITGIFEILMFFSKYKFRHKFEKLILKRGSEKYSIKFESTIAYKRFLLKSIFGRKESEYLKFVEEIDKALQIHLRLVSSNVKVTKFINLIYDPESKQRIYALLLAVGSAILALSIKFGSDLDTLFQSFDGFTFNRISLMVIFFAAILWGVLLVLTGAKVAIEYFLEYINERTEKHKYIGQIYKIKYLQIDLLRFHQFVLLHPKTENNQRKI